MTRAIDNAWPFGLFSEDAESSGTMTEVDILPDLVSRPWIPDTKHGFRAAGLFVGQGLHAIEVATARSGHRPSRTAILESWRSRRGRRAAPVLLVVLYSRQAALCGATGESPPIYMDLDVGQVERLCRLVLDQPDRHATLRLLAQALPSLETALPGLTNEGLLALHELERGVPRRSDWKRAKRKARAVLNQRDTELLKSLGFSIERLDNLTSLLRSGDRRTALAVMLRESESAEAGSSRFNSLSPITYAFKKADDENLSWVILTQGNRLRLYATDVNVGVGRRGRTETYVECQPSLLAEQHLPYLWLLYSAEALVPDGSLRQILEGSQRFAGDLAERLRERIYDDVVPGLARGIADARGVARPRAEDLADTYDMALTVLFRLLFIAYAEDRDLLPYRHNDAYRRRSLKQKAQELANGVASQTPIAEGNTHWQETKLLWQAVALGNVEWGVPAYDGGLFESHGAVSETGVELASITLPNECFEPALRRLLVIETSEGVPGPVDFRSLGVREFGTIYEGLLESELAIADCDLVLKKRKDELIFVPARLGETPSVVAGETYLHNRSGARKSSGSYYTKPFAVDYLLNRALEPTLDGHFERLATMDDTEATEAFFDFRVADIAMGSGHFLVGAIDRIEKRMADYLASRNLPGVRNELAQLRSVALGALGDLKNTTTIEDSQLLRRLIARHCIYGVDLNGLSVQLARLAVWIHTFVPGLPLSFLDHHLVQGNALIGVGTITEIRETFEALSLPLFPINTKTLLGQAAKPLRRLANINDASLQDINAAREAAQSAHEAIQGTRILCDLIAARSISDHPLVTDFPLDRWERLDDGTNPSREIQLARKVLDSLSALHFPINFPEVFLRGRPGFDVILGNPPWQEATIEEHAFWARHFPGLRSMVQRHQETEKARLRKERPDLVALYKSEVEETNRMRKALVSGAYPGMGTGDPDLYKAFCWRFWRLTTTDGGRIGVVLPRSALAAKGSEKFRRTTFEQAERVDVTMLVNNRRWVFPEVHPQYSIGLISVQHGTPKDQSIYLQGPYATQSSFEVSVAKEPVGFDCAEVRNWNDSASLPLLPNEESVEVFAQLRRAPRLDLNELGEWRARPDRELDATNQKHLMDLESETCPKGFWPVYKGESFDIWTPDTGKYYAWANPEPTMQWIQSKRLRGNRNRRSPHSEFSRPHVLNPETLPCFRPRVAFRDVSRATDSRTVRVALLPSKVFITNKGPYFLWPQGDELDQAFLLGVLASVPLDWYARRFVEVSLNFFILNPFPIPRPDRQDVFWQRVVQLAGRLASPDDRFGVWGESVGVQCGPIAPDEKQDMIHELDAVVSHLYGLSESQLVHVFETFHEGWDYQARLDSVLRHFRAWRNRR